MCKDNERRVMAKRNREGDEYVNDRLGLNGSRRVGQSKGEKRRQGIKIHHKHRGEVLLTRTHLQEKISHTHTHTHTLLHSIHTRAHDIQGHWPSFPSMASASCHRLLLPVLL
jgi:hypothetical protein